MVVRGDSGGDGCGYVLAAGEEVDEGVVKRGRQARGKGGGVGQSNGMDRGVGDDWRGG